MYFSVVSIISILSQDGLAVDNFHFHFCSFRYKFSFSQTVRYIAVFLVTELIVRGVVLRLRGALVVVQLFPDSEHPIRNRSKKAPYSI